MRKYNVPGSSLTRRPPNTRCRFCKSKHLGGCGTEEARDGCLKRPRRGDGAGRPGKAGRKSRSKSRAPGLPNSGELARSLPHHIHRSPCLRRCCVISTPVTAPHRSSDVSQPRPRAP